MIPSQRTVPVGTTVTFRNPGVETFPTAPNVKEHCATQFFEGKFNFRLQPGQTAQYTFDREGEYFYNDCTDPRPVGKVIVTLDAAGHAGRAAVRSERRSTCGREAFHRRQGPDHGDVQASRRATRSTATSQLTTPLTAQTFSPVTTR